MQSQDGFYLHQNLITLDGRPADQQPEFLSQLGELIMGYATSDNPDLDYVFRTRYRIPDIELQRLQSRSLRRLLAVDNHGICYNLKSFVGECLAHWIHVSFDEPFAITSPRAYSSEPAFDLVSISNEAEGLQTKCIQAKTTSGRAGSEISGAITKYERLHTGLYQFELMNELTMLMHIPNVRTRLMGRDWKGILLDADRRNYAIAVSYDGTPPFGGRSRWPENWAVAIPGSIERRILVNLQVEDCNNFIQHLAGGISARIA